MSTYEDGSRRPARPAPKPAWPGLLVGLVLPLALAFGLFWLRASLPETNFGRGEDDAMLRYWVKVILICVGLGVGMWAALWYAWVAKTGRDVGATLFGVVVIATLAGAIGAVSLKRQAEAGPREVAAMEAQWSATQDRDVNSLVGELNAIRLGDAIDAEAIRKDTDFSEAAARLTRARGVVEKHRRWREQRINDYRARLAKIPGTAADRKRVLAAFDRQRLRTEVIVQEFHDGVENALLETEALSKFLHRNRGKWRVEGHMITFRSQADFDYFERGVRHFEEAFSSQASLRWDLRGNPLLDHGQPIFADVKPSPRHTFVLF